MLTGKYLWRNRISNRKSETYWSSEGWLTDSGVGFEFGFMTGLKSRGPKPRRMAQVLPELHAPRWPLKVLHLWPVKLLHPGHGF